MSFGITLTSGAATPVTLTTNPITLYQSLYATASHAVQVYGTFSLVPGKYYSRYYSPPPWTIVNRGSIGATMASAVYVGAGGLLSNSGTINGGVRFGANNQRTFASASVVNTATYYFGHGVTAGLISGYGYGVALRYFASANVTNDGTIRSTGTEGFTVLIKSGNANAIGTITNGSYVYRGAYIGGNVGVYLVSGVVTNSGTIKGNLGIQFSYGLGTGGTVINAGTIIGTGVHGAIDFGYGTNRLVDHPGAVFVGAVRGHYVSPGVTNALELASSAADGTLSGLGVNFLSFNQVTVDAGGYWDLAGYNASFRNGSFTVAGTLNVAPAGSFRNQGTLAGAVTVLADGSLYNAGAGTMTDTNTGAPDAVVGAGAGVVVTNIGTIQSMTGTGVRLQDAGSVTNGAVYPATARIYGLLVGVSAAVTGATIVNHATIVGGNAPDGVAIDLDGNGAVDNGAGVTGAMVVGGADGIVARGGGSITNDATIQGTRYDGIALAEVGTIVNGANSGTAALITGGAAGILLQGDGVVYGNASISNFGSIVGTHGPGVYLKQAYGSISNGNPSMPGAVISGEDFGIEAIDPPTHNSPFAVANDGMILGHTGIYSLDPTQVTNSGTIFGSARGVAPGANGSGIFLNSAEIGAGGTVANGSPVDSTATIYGYSAGVRVGTAVSGVVTNYALIEARNSYGIGIRLDHAGTIVNGASGANAATISGYAGILTLGAVTITNDATIAGSGSAGIILGSGPAASDTATVANYGVVTSSGWSGIYVNQVLATIGNGALSIPAIPKPVTSALITGKADGILASQSTLPTGAAPALAIVNDGTIQGAVGVQADRRISLTNAGTIIGNGGTAVALGGTNDVVTVYPGGKFVGQVKGGPTDTLELAGSVPGTLSGIGVAVTNFGTIMVDANADWDLANTGSIGAGVSLVNAGTIRVNAGDYLKIWAALSVPAGQSNAVEVFPGGEISVYGSVAAGQTLTFGGSGGGILQIGNTSGFFGTISGFVPGTTIDLPGISGSSVSWAGVLAGVLTVVAGGSVAAELPVTGKFANQSIAFWPDFWGGTVLTVANNVACFAAGTRIRTERGEVPVEQLLVGDQVEAFLGGAFAPIVWIGHRTVDCRQHPDPKQVWPVRVSAGAFGPGLPCRDLFLSADHAVFIDDVLIPVKYLINGTSIAQVRVDKVMYYHVELPRHSVLLAEGLPAESYLDAGDRSNFGSSDSPLRLFPDFATRSVDVAFLWETKGCAQLVLCGGKLEAVRLCVNRLAERVGHAVDAAA